MGLLNSAQNEWQKTYQINICFQAVFLIQSVHAFQSD